MKLAINVSHDGEERIFITSIEPHEWGELHDMQPRIRTLQIGEAHAFLLTFDWGSEYLLKDNTFIPNAYRSDLILHGWVVLPEWFDLANDENFDDTEDAMEITEASLLLRSDTLSFQVYPNDEDPGLRSTSLKTADLDAYFPGFAITAGQETPQ